MERLASFVLPGRRAASAGAGDKAVSDEASQMLDELAREAPAWRVADGAARVALAKEMLDALSGNDWGVADEWVRAECELYGIDPRLDAAGASAAAASRFILGSIFGDWLKTFVAASDDAAKPKKGGLTQRRATDGPAGEVVFGPIALGPGAPGVTAELWGRAASAADPVRVRDDGATATETAPPPTRWRGEGDARAADGTACLVLGAGNQSFLTLIDALDRALVHGECCLVKLHPLRPWLLAPYVLTLVLFLPHAQCKHGVIQSAAGVKMCDCQVLGAPCAARRARRAARRARRRRGRGRRARRRHARRPRPPHGRRGDGCRGARRARRRRKAGRRPHG